MRWAIYRGESFWCPFMAKPDTPGWTFLLEDVYWFDSLEDARFRAVNPRWMPVTEDEVRTWFVTQEFLLDEG